MPVAHPSPGRTWYLGRWQRFSTYGFLVLLVVTVLSAAYPPPPPPAAPPADTPLPMAGPAPAAPAETAASPLDEPLRLVLEAKKAYAEVRDYTCRLVKRERIDGKLLPQTTMVMQVRTQPLSVYFRWQEPQSLSGQECCWVAGRNGGKMRVRPRGLLGAVGFVSLDTNDPRVRETSRHDISEAGIGNLIEQFAAGWEQERRWGLSQVQVAEYEYDRRRCVRVEVVHPTNPDGRFFHYRDVVYFDKETHLIVRMEAYDWPHRPGDPGDLLETFSYANLRLNVGLPDSVFNH
jgi:hypothetical protein